MRHEDAGTVPGRPACCCHRLVLPPLGRHVHWRQWDLVPLHDRSESRLNLARARAKQNSRTTDAGFTFILKLRLQYTYTCINELTHLLKGVGQAVDALCWAERLCGAEPRGPAQVGEPGASAALERAQEALQEARLQVIQLAARRGGGCRCRARDAERFLDRRGVAGDGQLPQHSLALQGVRFKDQKRLNEWRNEHRPDFPDCRNRKSCNTELANRRP